MNLETGAIIILSVCASLGIVGFIRTLMLYNEITEIYEKLALITQSTINVLNSFGSRLEKLENSNGS